MLFLFLVAKLSHSEVLSAVVFLLQNACMILNQMFVLWSVSPNNLYLVSLVFMCINSQ